MKQIMVVKPNTLSLEHKKLLKKEGYIIIENDDENCIKIVIPYLGEMLSGDELAQCLAKAVSVSRTATDCLGKLISNKLIKQ